MAEKGGTRKAARTEAADAASASAGTPFVASAEAKRKAGTTRLVAALCWVLAIAAEAAAIYFLLKKPDMPNFMVWLIGLIVVDLIFAVIGSLLWKKANRLDPASEKDAVRFFVQNQLGVIISVIAFLPLVILIFSNKNLSGKQKGIVGAVAIVALVIAGLFGVDFNPPSIEKYTAETQRVQELTGVNAVWWTPQGGSYHLYQDCYHIRGRDLTKGKVADAKETKGITDLCNTCAERALKDPAMVAAAAAAKAALGTK